MTYESFITLAEGTGDLDRAEEKVRADYLEIVELVEVTGYDQDSALEVEWGLAGLEWYLEGLELLREGLVDRAVQCAGEADRCLRAACRANREFRETVRFNAMG